MVGLDEVVELKKKERTGVCETPSTSTRGRLGLGKCTVLSVIIAEKDDMDFTKEQEGGRCPGGFLKIMLGHCLSVLWERHSDLSVLGESTKPNNKA